MTRTLAEPMKALHSGLDRVERLTAVIESLGHRRGFRELVESEEALRREQAAFVDRLSAASDAVAEGVSGLAQRISLLEESLEQRLGRTLHSAIAEIRSELERGVPVQEVLARLAELARAQGELARAQHQVEAMSEALRSESVRLRTAIEGWGRPKTVPEVAAGVRDLNERVEELEGRMANLAEDVAERVTRQVLDALEARGRRGLFRR
jgi:cell division septum initiation protein DivIVA